MEDTILINLDVLGLVLTESSEARLFHKADFVCLNSYNIWTFESLINF